MNKLILCHVNDEEIQNGLNKELERSYIFKISFSDKEISENIDLKICDFCEEKDFEYEIPDCDKINIFIYSHEDLKSFYKYYNSILVLKNLED